MTTATNRSLQEKFMEAADRADGKCECNCGTVCPLGKTGMGERCTAIELHNALVNAMDREIAMLKASRDVLVQREQELRVELNRVRERAIDRSM